MRVITFPRFDMQSLSAPVQIHNIHHDRLTATLSRLATILVVSIALLVSLTACSLLDTKHPGDEPVDASVSPPWQIPDDTPAQTAGRAPAGQQGVASMVEQLINEQQQYEARLLALEAIVLHGYPMVPSVGYPAAGMPASSAATAERLVSVPIEPDVITRPVMPPVSPGRTRVSRVTPPAGQDQPLNEPVTVRPQSAGNWAINLASYTNKTIAERMLAGFRQQDIAAELVTAVVNDATVYRVQIAGFETRQAALQHAKSLQERQGITDFWIIRN